MSIVLRYCQRCVYPQIAVNLNMDGDGVCSSCRTFERFEQITTEQWAKRGKVFEETLETTLKNHSGAYDCVVPVSGGKDSYFQTHVITSMYGLKPLLVTYHGNNYLPEGDYNRDKMRQVFDADHLVMGPSVEVIKKLNRLCFKKMGDMNWHAHAGIFTYPIQVAVKFKIPLIMWGEVAWDISGMFGPEDFVEFSARVRHEHGLRGFEWYDMLNDPTEKLTEKDLLWLKYPSDEEILQVGARGLYIGNYFRWDPNVHTKLVQERYGWKASEREFERTYRRMSNLDDRYENGAHDLLKFIKFGYGRASDHASKDVRTGYMNREEAVRMVRKYDSVVSSDLGHWLNYTGVKEDEFWRIADGFRDPRVWWIENSQWWKWNLWDEPSAYGPVHLPSEAQKKYLPKLKKAA